MRLSEELYFHEEDAPPVWKAFPYLDPTMPFLRKTTTRLAVAGRERDYPLNAIRFTLFPGRTDEEVNTLFYQSAQRGVAAINALLKEHVPECFEDLEIRTPLEPFDIFQFVKDAHFNFESGRREATFRNRIKREASEACRILELGYRTTTIDECPLVLNALQYAPVLRKSLEDLLGFTNKTTCNREGHISSCWDTVPEIKVYSSKDRAMPFRVKYLGPNQTYAPNYKSILMKIYKEREAAEEIKDYLGAELIVEDDRERDALVNFLRRETRPIGYFERYKDTRKQKTGSASSGEYGIIKFILRIPVPIQRTISMPQIFYERVPVEMQILTLEDHKIRTERPEVTHQAYKRRQFLEIFPALFPRDIYT
ncbi:hypothetical protein EXS74_01645 [Candidatus Woesearchaeota archaeon]|nr:hypothetical protein [Candidatus Woesearchaeota archaeon]